MSNEFEKELMLAVQSVVLKKIYSGAWLSMPQTSWNGNNGGLEISREFLLKLYSKIDMDRVSNLVLAKVEERVADKIFNQLATELGNDTKSLMCDSTARALFRESIKQRINRAADGEKG